MSTRRRFLVVPTFVAMAAAAFGQPTVVNFDFGAVPVECSSWGFTYEGAVLSCNYPVTQNFNASPGFGWTLGWVVARSGSPLFGGAGVTGPNSAINPPSFAGLPFQQAAILQSLGSFVLQAVPGFTAGRYNLSFYLGGRGVYYNGPQRVQAMIDGSVIGTWDVPVGMPFTLENATFTVSMDGNHALEFMGMNPYDTTSFLSYVAITPDGQGP
jgi:hypothetical protein